MKDYTVTVKILLEAENDTQAVEKALDAIDTLDVSAVVVDVKHD